MLVNNMFVGLYAGCLLRSLPGDVVFDNSSGFSFTCDLSDNIAAPWPSSSSITSLSLCAPGMFLEKITVFIIAYFYKILFAFAYLLPLSILAEMSLPALPTSQTLKNNGKSHFEVYFIY